jgi:arginase family enzyme
MTADPSPYRDIRRGHGSRGRPLSVGGGHSVTYPILKALGAEHCDTMGEIDWSKFHHGGPFRQAELAEAGGAA